MPIVASGFELALWLILGVLLLKLLWNVGVAFALLQRACSDKRGANRTGVGISMMTQLEIFLALMAGILSGISEESGWLSRPEFVALWSGAAVVSSYLLLWIILAVGSLLLKWAGKLP